MASVGAAPFALHLSCPFETDRDGKEEKGDNAFSDSSRLLYPDRLCPLKET